MKNGAKLLLETIFGYKFVRPKKGDNKNDDN